MANINDHLYRRMASFDFDDETNDLFTEGGCIELATAYAAQTKGAVVYVIEDGHTCIHALAKAGPDLYIDILGVWTKAGTLGFWKAYNTAISHRNSSCTYELKEEWEDDPGFDSGVDEATLSDTLQVITQKIGELSSLF